MGFFRKFGRLFTIVFFIFSDLEMNFLVTILVSAILISLCSAAEPKCKKNGFFRHPEDCTRFYRCVDLTGRGFYKKYTFSCPVGTVFDETVSVCNHPWAAPPCAEDMEEETEVPEESTEDYTETDDVS